MLPNGMLKGRNMMETPIFLFTGFLDSGKTLFIKDTLEDEEFRNGEKILIIACEEGEEEFDEELLAHWKTQVVYLDSEEELTEEFFMECQKTYQPDKIILEYNGMWRLEKLFSIKMPKDWVLAQMITTVNADGFDLYLNNMRSLVMEQFQETDMVIFNRCDENTKKASYRRSVKAINPKAQVYFENADGSASEPDESLPFDITQDTIEIEDTDFGVWYVDVMDNPEKYAEKTVKMRVQVYKSLKMPATSFVPGRFAMTCCVDDIRFIGPLCHATPTLAPKVKGLKKRQWIYLTAKVKVEYAALYKGEGPVLYTEKIESASEPEEKIVYFN